MKNVIRLKILYVKMVYVNVKILVCFGAKSLLCVVYFLFSQFQYINHLPNIKNLFKFKVLKLSLNERCTINELCNDLAGLSCQEGICKCSSSLYWKESKCRKSRLLLVNIFFRLILICFLYSSS